MRTCDEILEMLDEYADGELDSKSAKLVKKHISTCLGCHEQLEAITLINTRIREAADLSAAVPDLSDSVMAALPELRRAPVGRFRLVWGACAALVIAFAVWAYSPDHRGLLPAPSPTQMAMAPGDADKKPANPMCTAYCEAKLAGKAVGPPPPARKPLNAKCADYCRARAAGKAVGPPPLPSTQQRPG